VVFSYLYFSLWGCRTGMKIPHCRFYNPIEKNIDTKIPHCIYIFHYGVVEPEVWYFLFFILLRIMLPNQHHTVILRWRATIKIHF
jgi:hypothetical protein